MSDDLGFNKSYLSRVFCGEQVPPLSTRLKISNYLGIDSCLLWKVEHLYEIKKIIKKQKRGAE